MVNAYLFAAIAMLFWGIAPVFGKIGLSNIQPLAALTIRSLIITVILVTSITISSNWSFIENITARDISFIALEGICAALLGQYAYYSALKYGEVSRIAPIVAAFPLVSLILGVIFLGEKITLYKAVASLLIVGGIILLKY